MLKRILGFMTVLCLLTGCSAMLERTYSTAEPHSSKFWESEAAGTLRAENHQDVVNDLLLVVGQHRETATLRLYDFESDLAVADTLERAAAEVQQETPMGAYAVAYITTSSHAQRGYYEVAVRVGYRRTPEQLQAVVNATSPEALYSLLAGALDEEKTELAVRMGYWGPDGQVRLEEAMAQLREERELTETIPWVVNYYPTAEKPGLVEFLLDPPEPDEGAEAAPEDGGSPVISEDAGAGETPGPEPPDEDLPGPGEDALPEPPGEEASAEEESAEGDSSPGGGSEKDGQEGENAGDMEA